MALRSETRERARALQILYAWQQRDDVSIEEVTPLLMKLTGGKDAGWTGGERLARRVADGIDELDAMIDQVAEHWRPERIALVDRNILRIALCEMKSGTVPVKVTIDEAVALAHRFAGAKSPAFINGLLDTLARNLGLL